MNDDEAFQREIINHMMTVFMALPVRPQLKLALAVQLVTMMAHMMAMDEPEIDIDCEWRDGDTVFSVPARFMLALEKGAIEKNVGTFPKNEADNLAQSAREIYDEYTRRREAENA